MNFILKRQWFARRPGAILIIFAALSLSAIAASPLTGPWKGVYYTYPHVMTVELDFQAGTETASQGTLTFYQTVPERSAFATAKGSYHISADYNPATHTFTLKPGPWIERPTMGGLQVPIVGVFDTAKNQLAGTFDLRSAPNPQFFVAAPGPAGDQLVEQIKLSAYRPGLTPAQQRVQQQQAASERVQQLTSLPQEQRQRMAAAMQRRNQDRDAARRRALEQADATLPPGPAKDQVEEKLRELSAATEPIPNANWVPPTADAIVQWAAKFKQEMPGLDLRSATMDKLYRTGRNLFEDETFKACFGLTYDQMDSVQRHAVHDAFIKNAAALNEYGVFGRPFQAVGDFGPPDITVSIFWQRSLRDWLHDIPATFAAAPAARETFIELARAETIAAEELAFLWPEEKASFIQELAETRTRLSVPVLTDEANQLIASAHDLEGARALAAWNTREKDLLQYAPRAERGVWQQQIDARLDIVLEQLVANDLRATAEFGHGLAADEASGRWYGNFSKTYEFAWQRGPVQRALQQFQPIRTRTLNEAAFPIAGKFDGANSEAEVKTLLANYLSCPGDEATEGGRTIRQLADQRLAVIKKAEMLALFSEDERKLMDPPNSGHLDLARLHGGQPWAPSAEEVRLAILRGLAFGTGKMIDPHTARTGPTTSLAGLIVTIHDLKISRFMYDAGANDYMVEYTIDLTCALPKDDQFWNLTPDFRRGAQMAVDSHNAAAKLLAEEPVIQTFRLYSDGWGVPDLRQQGAGNAAFDVMLKSLMKRPGQ